MEAALQILPDSAPQGKHVEAKTPEEPWTRERILQHVQEKAEEWVDQHPKGPYEVSPWQFLPKLSLSRDEAVFLSVICSDPPYLQDKDCYLEPWFVGNHHLPLADITKPPYCNPARDREVKCRREDLEQALAWAKQWVSKPCTQVIQYCEQTIKELLQKASLRKSLKEQATELGLSGTSSASLERNTEKPLWLVEEVLSRGNPLVVAGPEKCLKTLISIDLAVSLGSGTPFLGRYAVPRRVPVWFISGESGQGVVGDLVRRICDDRGLSLGDLNCRWDFTVPQLGRKRVREIIRACLLDYQGGVVFLDPAYLCLTAGARPVNVTSQFDFGPLLTEVTGMFREEGVTLVLNQHMNKDLDPGRPSQLRDLPFCLPAFARQWLLLNRRRSYAFDGRHELVATLGGAGRAAVLDLDVDEGQPADRWEVSVRQRERDLGRNENGSGKRQDARRQANTQKLREAAGKLLDASGDGVVSLRAVREATGLSNDAVKAALPLIADEFVTEEGAVPGGNGAKSRATVLRRVTERRDGGTQPR